MFEMAAVSFNKVRLHYYVSQNKRLGIWLNSLLGKPSRLFGTTLIAINTFLQFGSEFSRKFYESIDLNPDFAPFTQIIIVLIFGELAPMFAARKYSEHVAFLYIPVVYVTSKLLYPLIWVIDGLNHLLQRILGRKYDVPLFLSREEIQKAFEEEEEKVDSLNRVVSNFFTLKNKRAKEVMLPIGSCQAIASPSKLSEMKQILSLNYSAFIPIYHNHIQNIVAIAYPRDVLRLNETRKVLDFAKPPWFITEEQEVTDILMQFRRNNQSVAVVVDRTGGAVGILTLDQLIDQLFGEERGEHWTFDEEGSGAHFEKTVLGEMLLSEFNAKFKTKLQLKGVETLSEYITKILEHHPAKGDWIKEEGLQITVIEPSLFGAKTLSVKSI